MSAKLLDLHLMRLIDGAKGKPFPVAIYAEEMSPETFEAVKTAATAGWMKPVLFGSEDVVQRLIQYTDHVDEIDVNTWETAEEALTAMIQLAALGSVSVLALPPTGDYRSYSRLTNIEVSPFSDRTALFGLSMLVPEKLERPLFVADTLVHAEPGRDLRIAQLPHVVNALQNLGINTPRVALLTAVEVASPGLPATMEAQEVAAAFESVEGWFVQGPLSMDLAVSEYAAKKKKATGEVPGKADLLAAPDLTIARGVLDALTLMSDTPAATVLMGGPVPVAVNDDIRDSAAFIRSIALACAVSA